MFELLLWLEFNVRVILIKLFFHTWTRKVRFFGNLLLSEEHLCDVWWWQCLHCRYSHSRSQEHKTAIVTTEQCQCKVLLRSTLILHLSTTFCPPLVSHLHSPALYNFQFRLQEKKIFSRNTSSSAATVHAAGWLAIAAGEQTVANKFARSWQVYILYSHASYFLVDHLTQRHVSFHLSCYFWLASRQASRPVFPVVRCVTHFCVSVGC